MCDGFLRLQRPAEIRLLTDIPQLVGPMKRANGGKTEGAEWMASLKAGRSVQHRKEQRSFRLTRSLWDLCGDGKNVDVPSGAERTGPRRAMERDGRDSARRGEMSSMIGLASGHRQWSRERRSNASRARAEPQCR